MNTSSGSYNTTKTQAEVDNNTAKIVGRDPDSKSAQLDVGIITYHTGYNYGASLQAFALMTTIKKMGYSCRIINFETERFKASREMFSKKPRRLKEIIKIAARLPYTKSLVRRNELFDEFTNNFMDLSPLYRTEWEVIDHAEDYKCIVCGSDQIWNYSQKDAPAANLLYFLNFPKHQKRVSYAASFGGWVKEAPKYEDLFMPWLKKFDAISVREQSGVDYLRSRGIDCVLCLDPTVLLDAEDYNLICAERLIPEKYILMFSWSSPKNVINATKKISRQLNLPVVNIVPPPRALFSGIPRKLDVGPREFLSMIKNAEFVVTNSFHGTAFSTTFEKPYVSIVSDNEPDTRMKSLLEQLGLENHLVSGENINLDEIFNTDYSSVRSKKFSIRKFSLDWLSNALKG